MSTRKLRVILMLAIVIATVAPLAGCGGGLISHVLSINSARALVSADWSSSGTWVKVLADITGYTALTDVIAIVKKIGSTETRRIELVPNAQGQFEGVVQVDENTDPDSAEEYTVTVTATDGVNTVQSDPVEVEVPPAESNPPTDAGQ